MTNKQKIKVLERAIAWIKKPKNWDPFIDHAQWPGMCSAIASVGRRSIYDVDLAEYGVRKSWRPKNAGRNYWYPFTEKKYQAIRISHLRRAIANLKRRKS